MRRVWLALLAVAFLPVTTIGQEGKNPQNIKLSAPATAVALSPQGRFAAVISADKKLSVWDLRTDQATKTLMLVSAQMNSVAISPDGRLVFVSQHDGDAAVWDVNAGKTVQQWRLSRYARSSAFSRDGRLLAYSQGGEPVQIFEVNGFRKLGQTLDVVGGVQAIAFSPDGSLLATADSDAGIRVYTSRDLKLLSENHDLSMEPLGVDFTADGKQVAAAGGDRVVVFVDTTSGKLIRRLPKNDNPIFFNGLKASADGALGLVFMKAENMSEPAPVEILNAASGEKQSERTLPTKAGGAEWTADGGLLCFGTAQNSVQIWRLP